MQREVTHFFGGGRNGEARGGKAGHDVEGNYSRLQRGRDDSYYQKMKMIFMWCRFLDITYGTMINEKEFYSLVRQQQ